MRRWISAFVFGPLTVVSICLISPSDARAESFDAPARLRFSLVHEVVPRYYEMFGLLSVAEQPFAGNDFLPAIDPPEALSIQSADPRDLLAPWLWVPQPKRPSDKRGATYTLSDSWTAQLSYQHSVLAQTLSNAELRSKKLAEFSTDRERDVLGLQMDWRLAGSNRLGVGYRFQSMRGEPGSGLSGIGERFMHSFTLGFTREWGGAKSVEP